MRIFFSVSVLCISLAICCDAANSDSNRHTCSSKPNIIFIVADDAGWNDFSFHGSPQIPTPNIDALALNGIILNNYYASPLCTPSRGAIMTGKHPIHIRLQHYVITGGMEDGLPLGEKLLPQYLKELDYATHLIGKWHLGHAREVYTPTFRGFDSHFGYWLGVQDYYDHFMKERLGFGYDFRSNMTVDYSAFGYYSTDLFTNEAIRLINNHPSEQPLFLMINHIAPHSASSYNPLQAPAENVEKFENTIPDIGRRTYAAMVDKLDESVGLVLQALSKAEMLENSIIVFTSDNGGAPEGYDANQGSNWPLRGVKNSLWEGGTRVAGFIWSPLLPNRVSGDLMHLQDWLPTLYEGVGGDLSALRPIDGKSQWKSLKHEDNPVRIQVLYNIDDIYNNSAIRYLHWKLVQGNASNMDLGGTHLWDSWYGPSGRNNESTVHDLIPQILNSNSAQALRASGVKFNETRIKELQTQAEVKCKEPTNYTDNPSAICDPYNSPCLFNIVDDPCEYTNLANAEPEVVEFLLLMIDQYNQTALKPIPRVYHKEAAPKNWGYVWTNWKDFM